MSKRRSGFWQKSYCWAVAVPYLHSLCRGPFGDPSFWEASSLPCAGAGRMSVLAVLKAFALCLMKPGGTSSKA